MARGTQLTVMIEDLRSEVGHSLQASLGKQTRDVLINTFNEHRKGYGTIIPGLFCPFAETSALQTTKDIMTSLQTWCSSGSSALSSGVISGTRLSMESGLKNITNMIQTRASRVIRFIGMMLMKR